MRVLMAKDDNIGTVSICQNGAEREIRFEEILMGGDEEDVLIEINPPDFAPECDTCIRIYLRSDIAGKMFRSVLRQIKAMKKHNREAEEEV